MTQAPQRLTVSTLGKWVGVGADTIRYYEKAGLLRPRQRTAAAAVAAIGRRVSVLVEVAEPDCERATGLADLSPLRPW